MTETALQQTRPADRTYPRHSPGVRGVPAVRPAIWAHRGAEAVSILRAMRAGPREAILALT
jgi:hypothetical protein